MQNKNKSLLKNIGLFTVGSFGSKILSFLLVPLYTAILSTDEYGLVDIITNTASLLTPILLLSIFDATLRFSMDTAYNKIDVISTSVSVAVKGSIALIIGVFFLSIFGIFTFDYSYLIFLCIYFFCSVFNQIFNLYLKAKNKASVIAISGIICTFITCSLNIILLLVFKWGIIGYMVSNTIGLFFQDLYQLLVGRIYKDIKIKNYNDLTKPMIKYSSPLIANSIAWWINGASDRYILTFFRGVSISGIYSVAYKIPTILSMFQGIYYNAWSISAISEFDENDTDGFIGKNYSIYSFVSIIVCSGLFIINIPLAYFLYKGDYFVAWEFVPFLLLGSVFSGISQFEGSLFAAKKNTKLVARTTVIGAIINTVLNFILIYYLGAIGAAISTLVGYLSTWLLRTIYLQKFIRMKVNWIIHILSIALVLIQSLLASADVNVLFQIPIFIILIILNKNLIAPAISVLKK